MTFIQWEFLLLLVVVLGLYWGIRHRVVQNLLLAASSMLFYGWIHPWFLILLYGSAVLDYTMGLSMARWPARKKIFLALSLTGNLGLLGYFKCNRSARRDDSSRTSPRDSVSASMSYAGRRLGGSRSPAPA